MENMTLGLTLMLIGMVTVFAILLIVINLSEALIKIVNKVAPEGDDLRRKAPEFEPTNVDALTMEIIRAAVADITAGKGTVGSVERLS